MPRDELKQVADLLTERNAIDAKISALTSRPVTVGHLGEWIAENVFDIRLEHSASNPAYDGRFRSGPLQGRTVNVKWYLRRDGVLDVNASEALHDYLVLTGPVGSAVSSYGQVRPWRIDHVYLFDAQALRTDLLQRGLSIGAAASVLTALWTEAEIYPQAANPRLPLTAEQCQMLRWFHPGAGIS